MIYDLSQPILKNVPQWPEFHPNSMTVRIEHAGGAWTRTIAWDDGETA